MWQRKVIETYCAKRMAKNGIDVRMLRHGIAGDVIAADPHN